MKILDLATVGLKLMGIYFMIGSISFFTSSAVFIASDTFVEVHRPNAPQLLEEVIVFPPTIIGISNALTGAFLFFFSSRLARRLIPAGSEERKEAGVSLPDLQVLAFAVSGLLVLAMALPQMGQAVEDLHNHFFPSLAGAQNTKSQNQIFHAIGIFAQLIFGIFLLLNPRAFRNAWHRLRTAGTRPTS